MLLLAPPAPKNSAHGNRWAWPLRNFAITNRVLRYGLALKVRSLQTLQAQTKRYRGGIGLPHG